MGFNRNNFKTKLWLPLLPSRPPCPLPPSTSSRPLPPCLAMPEGVDLRTLYIWWNISNPWYSFTWRLCQSLVCEVNQRTLRISLRYFLASSESRNRGLVCEQHKEPVQNVLLADTTQLSPRRNLGVTMNHHDASREPQNETQTGEIPEDEQKVVLDMVFDNLIDAPSIESYNCFFSATNEPPITKQSLSELDIRPIINNVKLRLDLNFDRNLHFRPIHDGDRGLKRQQIQKAYWAAIEVELHLYKVFYGNTKLDMLPKHVDVSKLKKTIQKRLPRLFETIKEIVINLIPERDQAAVQRDLDVPMLMQEIEKGLCDFVTIVQALASLLKRHCAPMRDEMVDDMVHKMQNRDPSSISAGLQDLFAVLEAMKLDVANHQIRTLRGLLIKDTIDFEQKHHLSRIDRGPIGAIRARVWYLRYREEVEFLYPNTATSERGLKALVTGLVSFLLPNSSEELPETFTLDTRRLRILKAELEEFQFLTICSKVFVQLVRACGVMMLLPSQACETLVRDLQDMLGPWPLPDLPNTPIPISNVSVQIARQAARYCRKSEEPDSNLIDHAESLLKHLLENAKQKDTTSKEYAKELRDELIEAVLHAIREGRYLKMCTWDLFNTLVPTSTTSSNPSALGSMQPQLMTRKLDIVRRITHIVVLHWRIWAPIVYLNENVRTPPTTRDKPTGYPDNSLTTTPTPVGADPGELLATAQDAAVPSTPAHLEPNGTNLQWQPSLPGFPAHEP